MVINRKVKNVAIAVVAVVVLIQFYRPSRNLSNDNTNSISKKYALPDSVQTILSASCYDCHSNKTEYPWYANVQPVSGWLAHHVNEGKEHLNFSEFASYPINKQYHVMQEVGKTINEGEMPIFSYTLIHSYAKLTSEQKSTIYNWVDGIAANIKASYPADSLVWKRRHRED